MRPSSGYTATVDARIIFIRRTYAHLAGAIGLFVLLSAVFYAGGLGVTIVELMGTSRFAWFLILGGFMVSGYIAQGLARSRQSIGVQYLGLGLYAAAEAVIFSPLIAIAAKIAPGVLPQAAIVTLTAFAGLTAYGLTSKQDFSFLGPILYVGGFVAMGVIVVAVLFGINIGLWFSLAMVAFATGAIVYSTSNILRVYPTDQYVAAALDLFAAVALLFWYVLRFMMELQRR